MFERTFNHISRIFSDFETEMRSFESEVSRISINGVTVQNRDGHVSVIGPYKSLSIDGRPVRLKEHAEKAK